MERSDAGTAPPDRSFPGWVLSAAAIVMAAEANNMGPASQRTCRLTFCRFRPLGAEGALERYWDGVLPTSWKEGAICSGRQMDPSS